MAVMMLTAFGMFFHVSKSQYPPALATKGLLAQLGLWPVRPPSMVPIPAGKFEMGDAHGPANENAVRTVRFARAFEMGKFEVTFEEYDLFAAATGRKKPSDRGWGRGKHPVIDVNWDDAVAYTQWLSKRTGLIFRLPTEAEWEYSARAGTTTPVFWQEKDRAGEDPACHYANVFDRKNRELIVNAYPSMTWFPFSCEDDYPFTSPVGKFEPNPWGLYDMLGNVLEWTLDCYVETYKEAPQDGTSREAGKGEACQFRVSRSGYWGNNPTGVRSSLRAWDKPDFQDIGIGFRLVRTP